MRRIVKILGLGMILAALLVVALAGTAFAGNVDCVQDQIKLQTQDQDKLMDGTGDNCINPDCVPNLWGDTDEPAPHGVQGSR